MAKQCNLAHRIQARRIGALDRLKNPSRTNIEKVKAYTPDQQAKHAKRVQSEALTLEARIG